MAAASTNALSFLLNQQDSNGVSILNRSIGAISYAGTGGQFTEGILLTTGATVINFPVGITNALQVYFKNTHATANITLNWTPLAATGSVVAQKLTPGSALAMWQAASGSSGGITALTGTADVTNATFELYLGG